MPAHLDVARKFLEAHITRTPTDQQVQELGSLILVEFYRGVRVAERKMIQKVTDAVLVGSVLYGEPEAPPGLHTKIQPTNEKKVIRFRWIRNFTGKK